MNATTKGIRNGQKVDVYSGDVYGKPSIIPSDTWLEGTVLGAVANTERVSIQVQRITGEYNFHRFAFDVVEYDVVIEVPCPYVYDLAAHVMTNGEYLALQAIEKAQEAREEVTA